MKIYLIVGGHPVPKSSRVMRCVAKHTRRLDLCRLLGYCPELNLDELLNQNVKTHGLGKSRLEAHGKIMTTALRP